MSGVARSGKDTFGLHLSSILNSDYRQQSKFVSFAQALKQDIDLFLKDKLGISAFTQDDTEKKLIRPMLVAYGMTMRMRDPNYWIKKVDTKIKKILNEDYSVIITDVRFPNEINFVNTFTKSTTLHISRKLPSGKILLPPNKEEAENDPLCKSSCDVSICWPTFSEDHEAGYTYTKNVFKTFLTD